MSNENSPESDPLIPEDHASNFSDERDHDGVSEILAEMQASGASEKNVQDFLNGARLDMSDKELLEHLREYRGSPKVQGSNVDEKWENFSKKHGFGSG